MGLLKVIEWTDNSKDTIVYKVDFGKNQIAKGSKLTVRDSQVAIFADKGRMADVFLPGTYSLDTNSIPLLTTLLSWKYGFEHPFKSDVYYVNTKQFTNMKWGTTNPILIRDAEYGAVRVRGFGTYSFRVKDAFIFMKELSGTGSSFKTQDITEYIKSMLVTHITDAIGEAKLPILDMASNLVEFGEIVKRNLNAFMEEQLGIEIVQFNFENFSLPDNLQKILDEEMELRMKGRNMNTYAQVEQLKAMNAAAANPGAGNTMGAGMGMGMGMAMGNMFGQNMNQMNQQNQQQASGTKCIKCGAALAAGAKFCPECGSAQGVKCAKCGALVPAGSKFCPECGTPTVAKCKKCGATLEPGAKFCPECGERQ